MQSKLSEINKKNQYPLIKTFSIIEYEIKANKNIILDGKISFPTQRKALEFLIEQIKELIRKNYAR